MYSLPIHTYSDYWRFSKIWSTYLGGLVVFAVGSRYSALNASDLAQMQQVPLGFQHAFQTVLEPQPREVARESSVRVVEPEIKPELARMNSVVLSEVLNDKANLHNASQLSAYSSIASHVEPIAVEGGQSGSGQDEVGAVEKKTAAFQTIENDLKPRETGVAQSTTASVPAAAKDKADFVPADADIRLTLNVEATAYTYTGNKTATGVDPKVGLIAVDPKIIALGSKLYVEGYGYAEAADTGGAIKGNRIDVFLPTERQCRDWGRKMIQIYVFK